MKEANWENTLEDLRHRLDLIQSRAHEDSVRFEELRRQAEFTKIQSLKYQLEARRKFLSQSRGVAFLKKNQNNLTSAGLLTVGLSVLTHMFTKDWLTAGVTGVNGALMKYGGIEWFVCLGQNLAIAPLDNVAQGKDWVTWDSLKIAMRELEERAKSGAPLGSLDNIISELKKSKKLLFVIRMSTSGATK